MKHSTVLAASLLLLLLGSPLLGLEGITLPAAEGAAECVTPSFVGEVVQATPAASQSFIPSIETWMTARECKRRPVAKVFLLSGLVGFGEEIFGPRLSLRAGRITHEAAYPSLLSRLAA